MKPFARLAAQLTTVEVVYAVREYDIDGNYYVDVVNPDTGQLGPMQCLVAGGDGKNLGLPAEAWIPGQDLKAFPLVVIAHRGDNRQPLLLDVLSNLEGRFATEGQDDSADTDSPVTYRRRDRFMHNGGSTVLLREDGSTVIDLAEGKSLFVNLNGGVLRVGTGDDAKDRALLAKPAVTQLNTIITGYNALLGALQTALNVAAATPAPGDVFVATLSAALGSMPALSSAQLEELQSAVLYLSSLAGK